MPLRSSKSLPSADMRQRVAKSTWALAACLLLLGASAVWAADQPGHGPSEAIFIVQLVVLMLVGRLLGEALLRLRQPAVMGQLMAGLVLGPSVLGALFPDVQHFLFPAAKEQKAMLDGMSQFGVLLILLMTGMETDLKLVKESSRASIAASIGGIIVPFACGFALGEFLPDALLPDPGKRLITSLFLGTALSIASVKIVATVVREMNFLRRTVGQVILGSAIVDDTIGWIIIAVIFGLALQGHIDPLSLAKSVIGTLAFMAFSLTVGRRLVSLAIRWVNDTFVSEYAVITAILVIMGSMALTTHMIGVHAVLGAFVAGILVGESPILTKHIDEQLRGIILAIFMPVFFGTAGLSADLVTVFKDPHLLALTFGLILIATIGKFGGAFIGGELGGLTRSEALALATGMNARGSTEVIVATVGLSMGALSQDLFTMIVAMAVITTLAMPPTLRWALARLPMRKEEKERLEREEMQAKGFVSQLERLLVAVDDSPNGQFGSRVAGMIVGTRSMPTTVMHITTEKKSAKKTDALKGDIKAEVKQEKEEEKEKEKAKAKEDAKSAEQKKAEKEAEKEVQEEAKERAAAAVALLKRAAEQMQKRKPKGQKDDKRLDIKVIPDQTTETEPLAEEAEKGYDLLVIGLDKTTIRDNTGFHSNITQLAAGFEGPLTIVDARDGLLDNPQDAKLSILVPVNGTETSRRAAEVAMAMARASRAPVTALYVSPPTNSKATPRRRADGILKDMVALGDSYEVEIKTAVRREKLADQAILKEMAKRKHNLIVMGVERRPGEKLFFGDTATAILEKSDRSIVFVVS
jgi:Kef-type K+ transport system membrane component KefB/nucleotide-binding universal stress UspA family protein